MGKIKLSLAIIFLPLIIIAKEQKIGFVESSKIFAQYQATATANEQFNEFVSTCKDSAAKLQLNVQNLKNEFDAQKLMLSEEARLKKLEEIERQTRVYNQYLQDVFGPDGKIEQKNDELMAPLLKKINDAIAKIAQQEGFSMVIDMSEDIFYASSELNITDLVINELNREYGITTPITSPAKKYIGILPFKEENSEAINEELGLKCQNELYNALSSYSHIYNIVSKAAINSELTKRKWDYKTIDENQAFQIARFALCNYIIMGKVSKTGAKVDYTMSLRDVNTTEEITSRSNSATDDKRLTESLTNDLITMLETLKKKE